MAKRTPRIDRDRPDTFIYCQLYSRSMLWQRKRRESTETAADTFIYLSIVFLVGLYGTENVWD